MVSFVVLILVESTFSLMCSGQMNKRQFKVANSLHGGRVRPQAETLLPLLDTFIDIIFGKFAPFHGLVSKAESSEVRKYRGVP